MLHLHHGEDWSGRVPGRAAEIYGRDFALALIQEKYLRAVILQRFRKRASNRDLLSALVEESAPARSSRSQDQRETLCHRMLRRSHQTVRPLRSEYKLSLPVRN